MLASSGARKASRTSECESTYAIADMRAASSARRSSARAARRSRHWRAWRLPKADTPLPITPASPKANEASAPPKASIEAGAMWLSDLFASTAEVG